MLASSDVTVCACPYMLVMEREHTVLDSIRVQFVFARASCSLLVNTVFGTPLRPHTLSNSLFFCFRTPHTLHIDPNQYFISYENYCGPSRNFRYSFFMYPIFMMVATDTSPGFSNSVPWHYFKALKKFSMAKSTLSCQRHLFFVIILGNLNMYLTYLISKEPHRQREKKM